MKLIPFFVVGSLFILKLAENALVPVALVQRPLGPKGEQPGVSLMPCVEVLLLLVLLVLSVLGLAPYGFLAVLLLGIGAIAASYCLMFMVAVGMGVLGCRPRWADHPPNEVLRSSFGQAPVGAQTLRRRLLVSAKLFELTAEQLSALCNQRNTSGDDEVMTKYDAFMLDPGLGPPTYLSRDGRIIWDDAEWWGVKGTRFEAFAAVRAGADKTGVVDLLRLLPARRADAVGCETCAGTGRFDPNGQLQDVKGRPCSVVCGRCAGLGWTAPSLELTESVLEK